MKTVELERSAEPKELLGTDAIEDRTFLVVEPNTLVTVQNEPELVYGRLEGDWSELLHQLKTIKYQRNTRVARLKLSEKGKEERTSDLTFGFKPMNLIMGVAAGACLMNTQHPQAYAQLIKLGEFALNKYKLFHPGKLDAHQKAIRESVRDHWRIPGTPYTQGIVNNTTSMRYHFDQNNFKNCWSVMAYFTKHVEGGDLQIPSLRARLKLESGTFVLFNGEGRLHGVTRLKRLRPSAYRYSVVFYSRRAMIGLGSFEEEMDRVRQIEKNKHYRRQGITE